MESAIEKAKPAEQEFKLITRANELFNNGSYEQCEEILEQQISTGVNTDACTQHNLAVARFYKSACRDHESLLKSLAQLDWKELEKTKMCLLAQYNKSVVYFHRQMYQRAIKALMPVIEKIDSVANETSALVGILMLRLLLATNQLRRAQSYLEFLQAKLGFEAPSLTTAEDGSIPESLLNMDGVKHSFRLIRLLTNVLNRQIVVIPEDGSVEFSALKAHQYYIMKDFQMAAKQLKRVDVEMYKDGIYSDELNTCIANNMGVIHLRVRHYAIALKFFQNAITFDKKVSSNLRAVPLHHKSAAHSCEILYNMGIAMLHLRRPKEAFQCFLVPLKSYHSNPRLWFRMAEACIMDHDMKQAEENSRPTPMVTNAPSKSRSIYSSNSRSAAVPEPNLEFAALSLRNALTLTQYYRSHFNETSDPEDEPANIDWRKATDNNFCNPSKPISKQSLENLLSAIYAAYSFVALRLGDYMIALEMAQDLLRMERLSDAHKMLAHMYAGEALIKLEKVEEAKVHLEPTFVTSLNAFDFETKDWQVKSLEAAQNIVRYNYAVALVLQGELVAAQNLLSTCTHPIVANKTKILKFYMESKKMGK